MATSRLVIPCPLALGLALGAGACNDLEKLDDDPGTGNAIPAEVQRAFTDSCATAGCHDSSTASMGLDLSPAAAPSIIGGMSTQSLPMVELGNLEGSYLAVKMLEEPPEGVTRVGARMPVGGDFESADNFIILGWIATASPSDGPMGGSDSGSTTDDPSDTMMTTGTGDSTQACGLADLAPGAANPYDIGMNAGQIPPDVGDVLSNNCGCHGVDAGELIMEASIYAYMGMVSFTTVAEFQADNAMGTPIYDVVLGRVNNDAAPMPPNYFCDVGGGEVITAADRQLLIDWLMAGAPDATTWSG